MRINKDTTILEQNNTNGFFKLWHDIVLIVSLLGDYLDGTYKVTPWNTLASIAVSFLYLFSPIDFIPDIIPIVGLLDDVVLIRVAISFCGSDIKRYKIWKDSLL